jgi:hypothetical protein
VTVNQYMQKQFLKHFFLIQLNKFLNAYIMLESVAVSDER